MAGKDDRLQSRACRVHGGGKPGRTGTDDDHFDVGSGHGVLFNPHTVCVRFADAGRRDRAAARAKERPWRRPRIPLEDDPSDVLRKAMRGNGLDAAELERRTGLPAAADRGLGRAAKVFPVRPKRAR